MLNVSGLNFGFADSVVWGIKTASSAIIEDHETMSYPSCMLNSKQNSGMLSQHDQDQFQDDTHAYLLSLQVQKPNIIATDCILCM